MSIKSLIDDLVSANHILSLEGVLDGFGHVSVRDARDPRCFLLSKGIAPATVKRADVMRFGLDGEPIDARGRRPYLERYIHSEIYRARPDVMAVVHSHSPALIPFGITGTRLRPVFHMSGFLGAATPIFEIREAGGPATDMLIRTRELGTALARSLGDAPFALMRGHGSIAVAPTLKRVVYRAIYAEVNARLQTEAMRLGEVTYLNDQEAVNASRTNDSVIDRPWDLWVKRAKSRR